MTNILQNSEGQTSFRKVICSVLLFRVLLHALMPLDTEEWNFYTVVVPSLLLAIVTGDKGPKIVAAANKVKTQNSKL